MSNSFKRFLSLALALMMVVSMMPTTAFATDGEGTQPDVVVEDTIPEESSEPEEEPSETTEPEEEPSVDVCTHETTTTTTVPATCETAGSETVTCECGEIISVTEIPALGHSYVEGICENCGEAEEVADEGEEEEPEEEEQIAQINEDETSVAMIGEQGYETLQAAIDAAVENQTITLVADIEQTDGVLITNKNITIDLNDKTFTVTEGASTNNRNIKITGSSVVTVKNGTMIAEGDYSSGAYGTIRTEGTPTVTLEDLELYNYRGNGLNIKAVGGNVTVNNVYIYAEYGGGIEAAGGTIELTDVTVEQEGMYTAPYNSMAISVNGGGKVTVNSGTYTTKCITAEEADNQGTSHGPWAAGVLNSGGTLIINGGTFSNDNFGDDALATVARGLILADTGAKIEIKGGTFNALKDIIDIQNNLGDASKQPGAEISGGTFSADPTAIEYGSFVKIAEGFKVGENADGTYGVQEETEPAKNIEVTDADGNVTYLENFQGFSASNVTLKLLSDVGDYNLNLKKATGVVLDLNGHTFDRSNGGDSAISLMTGSELTIKDSSAEKSGKVLACNNAVWIMNGTLVLENGTLETTSTTKAAIEANTAELTIQGGKIISAGDALLIGQNFMESRGTSTVEISGGEIEAAGYGIKSGAYAKAETAVTVTNGKITSGEASISFTSGKASVTGGTFSSDVSAYAAEGFECKPNADGTYGVEEETPAVKIGEQGYATLAEALAAAKTMTGNVVVEIYDKVTLADAFSGSYDSIKFVGKEDDAEIYMDVQGSIYATGEKVAFEDLKLSKVAGGYVADAGFRNLAFGIYAATEVTYTNCTFLNGAYASSGKATFNGCTFYRSHDRYGLWAYGDVDAVVDGCTFADIRGIKMYDEGKEGVAALTVKNTDFSAVNNKPAIVLTYGESVTLENNTYSSTGVFELDLDGAPNGTPVTSDVAPTCINDNGACGVLVDGKIYTTVAQAAEVATSGSKVTLLHNSAETVELAEGVVLDKNGFEAAGVTVKVAATTEINSLEDLIAFGNAVTGNTEYKGLKVAKNPDAIVKLTADLDLADSGFVPIGNGAANSFAGTFDGQGHTISNMTLSCNYYRGVGFFRSLATGAVVKNVTFVNANVNNGAATSANHFYGVIAGFSNNLTLENVEVKDSSVTCKYAGAVMVGCLEGATTIKDCDIDNVVLNTNEPRAAVYGILGNSNTGHTVDIQNSDYEDVILIINGEYKSVGATLAHGDITANTTANYVAKIGEKNYTTLAAAIAAAADGDTITLTGNVQLAEGLVNEKTITLDLAGKTISQIKKQTEGYSMIKNNGTLTINDTVGGGKISYTDTSDGKHYNVSNTIGNAGTLIINGGTIENLSSMENAIEGYPHVIDTNSGSANTSVTINGGKLYCANYSAIRMFCNSKTYTNSVEINGGEIYGRVDFQNPTSGKNLGKLTINGGSFDATVYKDRSYSVYIFGSNTTDGSGMDMTITGGTFAKSVMISNIGDGFDSKFITGGTFSTDVSEFCAEGYIAEKNADGTYGVAKDPTYGKVARVGDTYYATLQEAINAAQAGETVTVFEGTYAVPTMKAGIIVEGQGKVLLEGTLSGTLENLTLKNLHIKGGNAQRWAYAKGNLLFENVTFEATSVYALHFDGITAGTNLTYKNCTIIGWAAMGGSPASCVFDGCTIQDNGRYGVIRTYFNTTIKDCTFNIVNANTGDAYEDGIHAVDGAVVTVNGCTNADGDMKDLVNIQGASVVVLDGVEIRNVAKVGETYYATLEAAINAADGETVTMIADITLAETVTVPAGKTVTLDLNGNTVSAEIAENLTQSFSMITNKGNLTITDSGKNGKLSLKYTGASFGYGIGLYTISNEGGTVNVEGGTIENLTTVSGSMYDAIDNNSTLGTATLNIKGGTVSCQYIAVRQFCNSTSGENIVNVTDGTVEGGNCSIWVQNPTNNAVKGKVNVEGGIFTARILMGTSAGFEAAITGGQFTETAMNGTSEELLADGFVFASKAGANGLYGVVAKPVAKVGNTEYSSINEAIAAWTNNTTLTLLADVTLSDVIKLKSTEHHILNLGTYTMTAASGKNAFVIQACGTGSAERSALTINADATNPGGINAGNKSIVYYKYADGGISAEDRPIIKINGGVFTGTTSLGTAGIYTNGTAARKCATVNITGGTFNCSINGSGKSKLLISGGTFNYSVGSQGDSTALRLISGGKFKTLGFMTADSNNTKFWFGTSMGNSNVGVYVDDEGYLVVGGTVITEPGDTFEASSANYSGWSSYLKYSSAATNGLYYTSVEEAFADNNKTTGSVTVYVDELDMTGITYKGTIVIPKGENLVITFAEGTTPAWKVQLDVGAKLTAPEGLNVTTVEGYRVAYANGVYTVVPDKITVMNKAELQTAIANAVDGDTIILGADIDYGTDQLAIAKEITLDLGGKTLTTRNAYGGMSLKNNPTIKNGTIVHASNTAAIKAWNVKSFENLTIDVQGKGDAGKTIGGIVVQSGTTVQIGTINNVTIKGSALTNGIETYNCGDATENVIGSMNNVTINANGTGMLISAPCGTATGCFISGGVSGIEIWIKGNYSATLDLVDCDVSGGKQAVYAHDEFSSNPDIVNNGTLELTADDATTFARENNAPLTLTIARAENVEDALFDKIIAECEAKIGDTYYTTLQAAIDAAQAGAEITLLDNLTGTVKLAKSITLITNSNTVGEIVLTDAAVELTAEAGLNVTTTVADHEVKYDGTKYAVVEKAAQENLFSFAQTSQIWLIEPWALRANLRVHHMNEDGTQGERLTVAEMSEIDDFGVYFVRESDLDIADATQDNVTIDDIINNANVVHNSKSNGQAFQDTSTKMNCFSSDFDEGIYTYQLSDSIFVMYYIVEDGQTYYAPIRERNLSTMIADGATGTTYKESERLVMAEMSKLEKDILAYRGSAVDTELQIMDAPTLAENPLGTPVTNSLSFAHTMRVSLVEPWGIQFNARVQLDKAYDDYGVVVYYDTEGTAGTIATPEDLLNISDAHVFSYKNGDAEVVKEADGRVRIAALYNSGLYTYQMKKIAYVMFYVQDGDNIYCGPIKERSIQSAINSRLSVSGVPEKESAVLNDMLALYEKVAAHRGIE